MPSQKTNRAQISRAGVNRITRTRVKTRVAKARAAIEARAAANKPSDEILQQEESAVRAAYQALDRAASKGAIHRNTAARRKSRLHYTRDVAGE